MMRLLFCMIVPVLIAASVQAQPAPDSTLSDSTLSDSTLSDSTLAGAYRVFHADGRPATLDDVLEAMAAVEVVFLGEQHDDPVAHYLQAELLQQTYVRLAQDAKAATATPQRPLALSLEMFERDVQLILDEYLADLITESQFLRSSRPWQNYKTDYKPLVEFAKAHGLPVVAANAPRRYVNRVSRLGPASLDALSVWAKGWLPPLPYPGPSPAYEARWNQLMAEMMAPDEEPETPPSPADSTAEHAPEAPPSHTPMHEAETTDSTAMPAMPKAEEEEAEEEAAAPMHGLGYMLDAQSFWDANMAYSIHVHLADFPGSLVLHVVGSFHVEAGLGTPGQLDVYRPGTRRLVIITQATDDFTTFDADEHGDLGDFIILTDKALPRSFEASTRQ